MIRAASLSAILALAFTCAACSSTPKPAQETTMVVDPADAMQTVPEFHGAAIGSDSLRSLLDSE